MLAGDRIVRRLVLGRETVSGWLLAGNGDEDLVAFRTRYPWRDDPSFFPRLEQAVVRSDADLAYGFEADRGPALPTRLITSLLPVLLLVILLYWMFSRQARKMGGGVSVEAMQKSQHRILAGEGIGPGLDSVVGLGGAKASLQGILGAVRSAHAAGAGRRTGTIGAVLTGRPGAGKTLLAKALTRDAGLPLVEADCSDFVHIFVGVGVTRMRDLFTQAKANAPCIVLLEAVSGLTPADIRAVLLQAARTAGQTAISQECFRQAADRFRASR